MRNKRLFIILTIVAILLMIPFIAMQFTDEVNWTIFDFIVMGILLLSTGLLCDLALKKVTNVSYRIAICSVVIGTFLLIWAELAVGIFRSPLSGL